MVSTLKNAPKDWTRTMLGDVCQIRKGLTYKSSHYSNAIDGNAFLTLKSMLRGGGFNYDGVKYYSGTFDPSAVVEPGDLVIANTDITRDAAVVGAPLLVPPISAKSILISMDLSVLDVDAKKIRKDYLYYLLQSQRARDFMRDHANGSTVLHLRTKEVPTFPLALPGLPEQQRITEILSTVDEQIRVTTEMIAKLREYKLGLSKRLFSKDFPTAKLEDVASMSSGGTPPKKDMDLWNGDVPWVSPKDMKGPEVKDAQDHISEYGRGHAGNAKSGDILIVVRSGILAHHVPIGWVTRDLSFNQDIKGLSVLDDRKILPTFLFQYLLSKEGDLLRQGVKRGTTVHSLNTSYLEEMPVPVPGIGIQQNISAILTEVDKKISIYRQLKAQKILLKKGLMQGLLEGRTRTI